MPTIIATIEARMGSNRLPGKMTMEIAPGLTALGAVIDRLQHSRTIDGIVVATTADARDDALAAIATAAGVGCFRGSEDDVLGRVVGAGTAARADMLVLVTGDCTCVSPFVIDAVVEEFRKSDDCDLLSNCLEDVFPIGIDAQVVRMQALRDAYVLAQSEPYRNDTNYTEHTTYCLRQHPERFRTRQYRGLAEYHRAGLVLALDTAADLAVMRAMFARLHRSGTCFEIGSLLELLDHEPEILAPLARVTVDRWGYKAPAR